MSAFGFTFTHKTMRALRPLLLLSLTLLPLGAQSWDTSGNSMLNGTWYFRNVAWLTGDYYGDLTEAVALYGQITFSGSGTYTVSAVLNDSNSTTLKNVSLSGTYAISASGHGYISNPITGTDFIYGSVSKDVFVGASTEASYSNFGFNDFFVAARLASTSATVSSLRGNYTLAYMDLSGGSPDYTLDSAWQMSPDGNGNLGNVQLRAYMGSYGSQQLTQTISGVKYIFSNGAANMQFPRSQTALLSGNEYLYLSPDGNFVFGGSPEAWDFFVGVKNPSSAPSLSGLYFQAGIDMDTSTLAATGLGTLDSYYGAFSASGGTTIGHKRFLTAFDSAAYDYTGRASYTVASDGTYTDSANHISYVVGAGGHRIGLGTGPYMGIHAAVPVSAFSGSGVFLNPAGVVNSASSAPFTAAIAPGELITLYGSGLAASTVVAPSTPFPAALNNVQVKINGVYAPIYYVSDSQISVVVPYATTSGIASIQVINNGTASNTVSVYTADTAPGVFTNPVGGLGYAAALHGDYSLVSATNPARPGEYISVYLTGLGAVTPTIVDGGVGPLSPLSNTVNSIAAYVGSTAATISYAGLAPQLAGLYQINIQVPATLTSGDATLVIQGPDSWNAEALLPVGTTSGATAAASKR